MPTVREQVQRELERTGWKAGEGAIFDALKDEPSRRLVRRLVAELKAEHRRRLRRHREENRTSRRVLARDAVWALDATHVGRDAHGHAVQAEVLRDVAPARTTAVSIGPAATASEVIRQLEEAAAERGGPPLVLQTDNGGPYKSRALRRWCRKHGVVQLFNLPRTPQHNAEAEHGIGEIKSEAELPRRFDVAPNAVAMVLVLQALQRIDHVRPRPTRGGLTAAAADGCLPSWRLRVSRERFYATARCAHRLAVLDCPAGRARLRAEREAVMRALERFELIQRTRGGRPWTPSFDETFV
jgi:transposase InsO family protein